VSVSDPVIYPAPRGSAEAVRQDIWRTRLDLEEALSDLLTRMDAKQMIRRRLVVAGRGLARNPVVLSSAAAAIAAGLAAATAPTVRRQWRLAAIGAAGVVTGAAVVMKRRPVIAPVAASVEAPSPSPLERYPSPPGGDVVDVLLEQHRLIQTSLAMVRSASGRRKFYAFTALVDLLNRHEHAEQEIVHPILKGSPGGARVAEDRLYEEASADRLLARLISMGVEDSSFDRQFDALRTIIGKHAWAEETQEFPLLRANVPAERLQSMANQVRAAQSEPW
jgi:Hemerythrin HHE cation binding domain